MILLTMLPSCYTIYYREDDNSYLHGCNVLYELVRPWANTDAIVVADSYFASVQAAIRLKSIVQLVSGSLE